MPVTEGMLRLAVFGVVVNVIRNLWAAGKVFLQEAPDKRMHGDMRATLLAVDGVKEVHH
jgi:cobalt-zinc-cadmium efflux system protein|tara:strand:- start:2923 stop:3099 length:177 start_codon:yes stop_codon:yes gene_type:complete